MFRRSLVLLILLLSRNPLLFCILVGRRQRE